MRYEKGLSILWILKADIDTNRNTLQAFNKQQDLKEIGAEVFLCPMIQENQLPETDWIRTELSEIYAITVLDACANKAKLLNHAAEHVQGEFVITVESGDCFDELYLKDIWQNMHEEHEKNGFLMGITKKKCRMECSIDELSDFDMNGKVLSVDFRKRFSCVPYFMAGTCIHSDYFCSHSFREDLTYEWEKEYLLRAVLAMNQMLYVKNHLYEYEDARENNLVYFPGGYEKEWYYEAIDNFWVPFLAEVQAEYGQVPPVIQYQVMFALNIRTECNLNNLNKHCIPEEETEEYLWSWNRLLRYVDDEIIMNARNISYCTKKIFIKQLFLKIKYMDESYALQRYYWSNAVYYGAGNVLGVSQKSQNANIQFMEYVDGNLVIDGTLSSLFDLQKGRFYVQTEDTQYEVEYNQRYSHTKLFGFSISKRIPFRVSIPIQDMDRQQIEFRYELEKDDNRVTITYDSHTSRLSTAFTQGYWMVTDEYMATAQKSMIVIYRVKKRAIVKRELLLWLEMLKSKKAGSTKFMGLRMAYFLMKPFWHRRPVWMFIDKIYKAGDSSEYLYRYASAQKDGIDKYYLVDKDCPDYARLKKDGYTPLKRGSFKHRLMFLYADMMVISNSTVFAFNDYTLSNSAYMRDLFHFHAVCVQHGMSVQKIAIAQNRLRDNLRLYFCASKYEIENLSHPVYDYIGHDVLKLTGVPRYDGLINDDKRQILISPTWRMQAAVPVSKNEGVARSYNPLFKETAYFKVYNDLINDERLIEAAKKYNYRILYVLHPIVSPQAEDFDKNEYVDIVPSVGDMSYEKVFRESSLMVSDYSGVQFDFAYMRKPLVYLHHDAIPQHYEEGTFHYDTMAFGEICHNNDELIDVLIEYMKNDCQMKPEYRRRADDFFAFSDHNNCQRIYDIMLAYQKDKIGF